MLLRDLRPPWLTHAFPQALPGNSLLSRYTRPCFLQWDLDEGLQLFGESVANKISQHVRAVDLELVGFLARPLYVCTASSGSKGEMCMSLASMSQLVKQTEGRQDYRCRKCAENDSEREPASSSSPLRVLHLYALVDTSGPAPTPMHMQPVRLVVTAPPPEWAWGLDDVTDVFAGGRSAALPQQGRDSVGAHWRFNKPDSEAIWRRAHSYCGNPSEILD